MITAKIFNGRNTLVIDLPRDRFDIAVKMHSVGIETMPSKVRLQDNGNIRVELSADNDIEKHLLSLFNENCTLAEINSAVYKVQNSPEEIRDDLEQNLIYDQYDNLKELLADIEDMTYEVGQYSEIFYFPLVGNLEESDEYEPYEVDNSFLRCYEWDIEELIEKELSDMNEDMKDFFYDDDNAQKKMVTVMWGVEEKNGVLYGKTEIKLREPLTPEEKEKVRDWVSGQNSDGFGEGLEQRPIETEDGDLYVSMWNSDNYFIYDSDEFEEYLLQQQNGGMTL